MRRTSLWTMVTLARFFLSVFALLSVYVDPTQPAQNTELAYLILVAYLFYAGLLWTFSVAYPKVRPSAVVSHVIDIAFFSTLIHLTDGPSSPFFVYFTFALFSATLRWSWRGALVTTAATVLIFAFLTGINDAGIWEHIDRIIVRTAYLIIAGALFCYFGAALEHARHRLAQLAAWPVEEGGDVENPRLDATIGHAARALDLRRILVIWQYYRETYTRSASLASGHLRNGRQSDQLPERGDLPSPILIANGRLAVPDRFLDSLLEKEGINYGLVMALDNTTLHGWMLLADDRPLGKDVIPMAAIVATRIAAELEQQNLRRRLIQTAAKEERVRLAQDIHDDVLQSLAAASLQLKTIEMQSDAEMAQRVGGVRRLLSDQQQRLRSLVLAANERRAVPREFRAVEKLNGLLNELGAQWRCSITLSALPSELILPERDGKRLLMFAAEAVANCARHGGAKNLVVTLATDEEGVKLSIADDGSGIPGLHGDYDHPAIIREELGSASLRRRALEMEGELKMSVSPEGTVTCLEFPLRS